VTAGLLKAATRLQGQKDVKN